MRRHFLLRSFLSWELSGNSPSFLFVFETIGALIYIFIYVA